MRRLWLVAIAASGCAWQQQQAQLRATAAGHLGCAADDLTVFTRDGLGRVKGCGKEALYELEAGAWLMESVFPTTAKGVAYVPKCGAPEVIRFEPAEDDLSEPVKGEQRVEPQKLSGRNVRYPRGAAAQNIKGAVTAQCDLSSVGLLTCCDMDEERALLDDEIRATLATWRFLPAQIGQRRVQARIAVQFTFELY
jgi:TonB family protein